MCSHRIEQKRAQFDFSGEHRKKERIEQGEKKLVASALKLYFNSTHRKLQELQPLFISTIGRY